LDVKLIDVFGSDERVCDAARVSFSKQASNYTKEQNNKLVDYLAKHNHFSPFTHVLITMKEKVPIFVARQRFKHKVGFEYNEVSRRYVDDPPEFFIPSSWRGKPESAKQGSSDEVIDHFPDHGCFASAYDKISDAYKSFINSAESLYSDMLHARIAPEQARMVLPQSMYTEYIVTGSLSAWARAYKLRTDTHSQLEIQLLARQWGDIIGSIEELRYSWQALKE
jgi:thymidylate synthase (FAD)